MTLYSEMRTFITNHSVVAGSSDEQTQKKNFVIAW
jgi:hypothetical protein